MKPMLATSAALAVLTLSITACGESSTASDRSHTASHAQTSPHLRPGERFPGTVDNAPAYGYPASSADENAIRDLVRSYYTAAVSDDGARGCSMIYPTLEHSVAEDYGHAPAPLAWRGNTCQVVLGKFFKRVPQQPRSSLAETTVTAVRVYRNSGYALLHSKTMPHGQLAVQRAHGVWKVEWLIGREIPIPKN